MPADRHVHASLGIVSTFKNVTKKRYAIETSHEQHGGKAKAITLSTEGLNFKLSLLNLMNGKIFSLFVNNTDNGGSLATTLIVACCFFGILLILSIIGYLYLRLRMGPRLRRLPSDHHELTLQGPIIEVVSIGFATN